MDFSMIRPKPPAVKLDPPPREEVPHSSDPPPAEPEAPPPPPPHYQEMAYPYGNGPRMGTYMEELDRASHMHRLRNIEYTNARTWRVNFGGYSDDYYHDNHYTYDPSGGHQPSRYMVAPPHSHEHMLPPPPTRLGLPPPDHYHGLPGPPPRLGLPPPDHYHGLPGPPPRLGLPPPDHYHGLPGPPPRLALPPPDYHHGPPGPPPPPSPYYHSQPHYGYFSEENPNGCTVM
ncbi:extensin-like [Forsythia ovata]|uniref:Extensin-like n=1 Tax=Forsythia ovata TaxID=205694 RepID=A0ABD1RIJ5_9LAMI